MNHLLSNTALGWVSTVFIATGLALLAHQLVETVPLDLPSGGRRGKCRQSALNSPLLFAFDPLLRRAGALIRDLFRYLSRSPLLRAKLAQVELRTQEQLIWAGEPGGLDRFELIALSFAGALFSMAGAAHFASLSWVAPAALLGFALPYIRLHSLSTERFAEVSRELPAAIDLIALAMSAGSDFPSSIRRVIAGQPGVVADELREVVRSLDLGITRIGALFALKDRMPVPEVKDLVRAVTLAEQKGASICDALGQQASASRQRRSVRAEEAAARAGVLLIVPLMLLMGCILIMLVGPLMNSGVAL